MTTDEFQAEQARKYAQEREQDWKHKQHLDSLSSFSQRFEYWKNEVCKHDLRGTINYDDFVLSIEPNTKEEQSLLHQFHFEWYRALFIRERRPVKKSNRKLAPYERANETDTAFEVQSLDELKSDLAAIISTKANSSEREILLQDELTFVTNAIDSTCDPIKVHNPQPHEPEEITPAIKGEIKHLRGAIRRGKYCYIAADGLYQDQKTIQLAQVWDIVHYEAFLQNSVESILSNLFPEPVVGDGNGKTNNIKKPAPLLYINPASKNTLFERLSKICNSDEDSQALNDLLHRQIAPTPKITFTASVKKFGSIFQKTEAILPGGALSLSHQLISHFERTEKGKVVPLCQSYLFKVLTNKEK